MMVEGKNVRVLIEWEDAEGKRQSQVWTMEKCKYEINPTRNVTPDHVELLRQGKEVQVRSSLDLKVEYVTTLKGEENR